MTIEVGHTGSVLGPFHPRNASSVGNGWTEIEAAGAAQGSWTVAFDFTDTSDVVLRAARDAPLPEVTSGSLEWEFDFDWTKSERTGYALAMQLGDGAQMSADSPNAGIGVNLVWGRLGASDQTLGFRSARHRDDAAAVNGLATIRVPSNSTPSSTMCTSTASRYAPVSRSTCPVA